MGGVYVAKPDIEIELDVPPDWNPNWTFPGPSPPGYETEYSFGLAAQATMEPGVTVSDVTLTLVDNEIYVTTTPSNQVRFSATWQDTGSTVGIKEAGPGEYQSSISSVYVDIGESFFGAEPDLVFNASVSDIGRVIVLVADGTPFEEFLSDTALITVALDPPDPDLPEGCSDLYEWIACEFGQTDLLHTTTPAVEDLDCGASCVTENPGCNGGRAYCTFMDWAPLIHGLLVGTPGFYGRSWYVKRYNTATGEYASGFSVFPNGTTGTMNCDGTLDCPRDTSGTLGMGFASGGTYELHLFVRCPLYRTVGEVLMRAQMCLDEGCV